MRQKTKRLFVYLIITTGKKIDIDNRLVGWYHSENVLSLYLFFTKPCVLGTNKETQSEEEPQVCSSIVCFLQDLMIHIHNFKVIFNINYIHIHTYTYVILSKFHSLLVITITCIFLYCE